MAKKNPAKFDRCVKKVKAKGGAANAYAVCKAAGAGKKKKRKRNPAGESAAAYEDFHGRPSMETVTVEKKVHYHKHLAALGDLKKLVVIAHETGDRITLEDFGNALLAMNEKRNQLFIEGGDQTVDLEVFGCEEEHESYVLGEVVRVEYFTTKDHLGKDGGTAIYDHEFSRPYPVLQYDAVNEALSFSGGGYTIPSEGIDN